MLKKVLLALALCLATPIAGAQNAGQILNLNGPSVTVGTSPTLIVAARVRNAVTLYVPTGGATVYIDNNNQVTTSNGFPLVAGQALTLQPYNGAVWGVVSSSTQTINELESY